MKQNTKKSSSRTQLGSTTGGSGSGSGVLLTATGRTTQRQLSDSELPVMDDAKCPKTTAAAAAASPTTATASRRVRFRDSPTEIIHISRTEYTDKKLRKCFYALSDVQEFTRQAERMAKKSSIASAATTTTTTTSTISNKKKSKKSADVTKKSKKSATSSTSSSSPALLYDLDTNDDDGRGLECWTKAGRLRRQMNVKLAVCAVMQRQKNKKQQPRRATTTSSSSSSSTPQDVMAVAYSKETKQSREQALVRGMFYGKRGAAPVVSSVNAHRHGLGTTNATLMESIAVLQSYNEKQQRRRQQQQQQENGDNNNDDDKSIRSVQTTQTFKPSTRARRRVLSKSKKTASWRM